MTQVRLDMLQDNALIAELSNIQTNLNEIKNRQYVSGSFNVVTYVSHASDKQYDASYGPPPRPSPFDTSYELASYRITFVAERQDYALVKPIIEVWVNQIDDAHKLNNTYSFGAADFISGVGYGPTSLLPNDPSLVRVDYATNARTSVWDFAVDPIPYPNTVFVKVSVIGTDRGTITLVRTNIL